MIRPKRASERIAEMQAERDARNVRVVSMAQARVVLAEVKLLSRVDAEIAKGDDRMKAAWEYSTELRRDSEVLKALAVKLKLSDEEVDALFKQASSVRF
jgi:hypothetical protein